MKIYKNQEEVNADIVDNVLTVNKCHCGAEFKLKTSLEDHSYLPESFESGERSEIKNAELEAIHKAMDGEQLKDK